MSHSDEMIQLLDMVAELRRCQKEYFAARKRHDHQSATNFLDKCKAMEPQVDSLAEQLSQKLKHGEQQSLF